MPGSLPVGFQFLAWYVPPAKLGGDFIEEREAIVGRHGRRVLRVRGQTPGTVVGVGGGPSVTHLPSMECAARWGATGELSGRHGRLGDGRRLLRRAGRPAEKNHNRGTCHC